MLAPAGERQPEDSPAVGCTGPGNGALAGGGGACLRSRLCRSFPSWCYSILPCSLHPRCMRHSHRWLLSTGIFKRMDDLSRIRGARIVDGHAELCRRMRAIARGKPRGDTMKEAWDRAYSHWAGVPARVVNSHQNPAGHRILGNAIAREITRLGHSRLQ